MALVTCEECGREISSKAAACPGCGCPVEATPSEGSDLPPVGAQRSKTPRDIRARDLKRGQIVGGQKPAANAQQQAQLWGAGCVVILIVLCVIGAMLPEEPGDDKSGAWVMSTQFVEERLRSPASAEFPWYPGDHAAEHLGDNRYRVVGHVDSQNGFGAMVRSQWACIVRKEKDRWILEDCVIE